MENKTQKQQTKHLETEVSFSNLDLNTAREKPPSLSVFVEIFVWFTRFSFVGLNRTRNFHFFFTTWELAEGRYTSLSDIVSRVFQRWKIQNYKRFARVNGEFSQFSTSSSANSLQNKSTLVPEETEF